MSRPVSSSDNLTFTPSSFDTTNSSYNGVSSTYGIDYGLQGYNENTNYYAAFYLNTGSNAETFVYYNFDCSSIPVGATINSISCTARGYIGYAPSTGNGARINTANIQLCTGTSTKGSPSSLSTTATNYNLTTGTWNRSELNNIKIRFYAKRGTSRTTTQYEIRSYGATLTISYSYEGTEYQISISNNVSGVTVSPTGTNNWVIEGGSQEITFTNVSDFAVLGVTDNNTNVTSQLVNTSGTTYTYTISDISEDHTIAVSTVTAYNITASSEVPSLATVDPSSGRAGQGSNFDIIIVPTDIDAIKVYDNNTDVTSQVHKKLIPTTTTDDCPLDSVDNAGTATYYSGYPLERGAYGVENTGTNNQHARIAPGTANASRYAIYNFAINIPNDASIISVSCQFRGYPYNTSYVTERTVQLYSGTTAKGSIQQMTATSYSTVTSISDCGTWTAAELNNAKLRVNITATNANSSNYTIRFYGATLTVQYSYNAESATDYEYTVQNVQAAHTVVVREAPYLEITGSSTFDGKSITGVPKHIYTSGSEYSVGFSGITNPYSFRLSDNNTDVTSSVYEHNDPVSNTLNPAEYSGYNGTVTNSSNGLSGTDSNTYAQLLLRSGTYMEYSFDTSGIPANAVITSISCSAKGCVTRTRNAATVQLYNGTTAKGSTTYLSYNSNVTIVDLTCGTWTRAELSDIRIRIVSTYTSTTTYYANFYGANLVINYTLNGLRYTISSVTIDHALVLSEAPKYAVSGTSNFSGKGFSGTGDVYHGDSITVTLTGLTNQYSFKLYDNNVDVTSSVNTSNWTYSLTNVTAAHALRIEEATKYAVTGTSNFTGVSITGTGNVYQGDNITVSLSGITDAASFNLYDNDIDVTNNVNSSYQYTISNAQGAHVLRVEENNYVTISGSSTFTGVSFSGLPKKIYQANYGTSYTATITGATSPNSFVLTDNDRDVTNFVDNYQYVIQNINEDHTLAIEEAQYYSVTGSSTLSGVSITGTSNKVYAGDSITVTITGVSNIYAVKLTDNGVDKSADIQYVSNSYRYTISNIFANHTLAISQQDTVTITTSSSYSGATLTSSVNSIYKGESAVLTLTGVDISLVSVRVNNNRMITGLFEETGTNEYTCTLEDIRENLTIVVIQKVTYTITCTDNATYGNITPTGTATVDGGFDTEYVIESDYFDRIYLKDNNVIVNDDIYHKQGVSSSDNTVLGTYTLVEGSFNGSGATYFQGIVGNGVNASQTTSNYYSGGSSTIAVFTYDLSFANIPADASITRLYCQVNGHAESTSNSSEYMCVMLMVEDSSISDEYNFKSAGTSNSTQTITATTLPTVSQLSSLKLRCRLGYYGGAINGATCYIEYVTPDYYTYTVENISTTHTLVLSDRPTYQLTSSSTVQGQTASITPASVTVYENNPATFIISATDISGVRLTDNNTEVTEDIIYESGQYKYVIDAVLAAHTIVLEDLLIAYLKLSGAWVKYSKIYKKINGAWVQQATNENILDATTVYIYNS